MGAGPRCWAGGDGCDSAQHPGLGGEDAAERCERCARCCVGRGVRAQGSSFRSWSNASVSVRLVAGRPPPPEPQLPDFQAPRRCGRRRGEGAAALSCRRRASASSAHAGSWRPLLQSADGAAGPRCPETRRPTAVPPPAGEHLQTDAPCRVCLRSVTKPHSTFQQNKKYLGSEAKRDLSPPINANLVPSVSLFWGGDVTEQSET